MTHDGVREATKKALKIAKDNGLVITLTRIFDHLFGAH